jgi:hypothetical protein
MLIATLLNVIRAIILARLTDMETAVVSKIQTALTYLNTCRGVSDIKTFLTFETVVTPGVVVVFDGESASTKNLNIGGAVQQTELVWSIYVLGENFDDAGSGRIGVYTIIDDVINTLEGAVVTPANGSSSKLFYLRTNRVGVTGSSAIVYQVQFRCQSIVKAA